LETTHWVCDAMKKTRVADIQGGPAEIRELARYEVRPESLEQCLPAIHEFVAYVRPSEPGALRYEVWQEAEHPTRFVILGFAIVTNGRCYG
jgi:antibiotic biosynthesis monooxygenase